MVFTCAQTTWVVKEGGEWYGRLITKTYLLEKEELLGIQAKVLMLGEVLLGGCICGRACHDVPPNWVPACACTTCLDACMCILTILYHLFGCLHVYSYQMYHLIGCLHVYSYRYVPSNWAPACE